VSTYLCVLLSGYFWPWNDHVAKIRHDVFKKAQANKKGPSGILDNPPKALLVKPESGFPI